ncbi:MAG: CAP domain-containing protein [Candidatus Paceibacterota bacterium]
MWKKFKHFFIPHHENDHKPHLLRDGAVEVVLGGIIVLLVFSFVGRIFAPGFEFIATVYPSLLVDMANESRQERGLNTLRESEVLVEAARAKAEHMIQEDYFDHYSPEGVAPWYWFDKVGYTYTLAGENLAINFSESEPVNRAWMDSPTHRENILEAGFSEIGIAAVDGVIDGQETTVVVQMFGTPASGSIAQTEPSSAEVAGSNTESESVVEESEEQSEEEAVSDTDTRVALASEESEPAPTSDTDNAESDESIEDPEESVLEGTQESEGEDEVDEAEPRSEDESSEEELSSTSTPNIVYEDESFMLFSSGDTRASTTVAAAQTTPSQTTRYSGVVERLVVNPSQIVTLLYMVIVSVLATVLFATVTVEFQKQHPMNVAYGCLLLVILGSAIYINETLVSLNYFTL